MKTTALDAHDPIVVLGNNKGYVAPWIKDSSNKNVSLTRTFPADQENLLDCIRVKHGTGQAWHFLDRRNQVLEQSRLLLHPDRWQSEDHQAAGHETSARN